MGMTSSWLVISTAPAYSTGCCLAASAVLGDGGSGLTGPPTWYHEGVVVSIRGVGVVSTTTLPLGSGAGTQVSNGLHGTCYIQDVEITLTTI